MSKWVLLNLWSVCCEELPKNITFVSPLFHCFEMKVVRQKKECHKLCKETYKCTPHGCDLISRKKFKIRICTKSKVMIYSSIINEKFLSILMYND